MIDSHCHLADDAFSSDIAQVVERASAAGVNQALCILDVTNEEELKRAGGVVQLWPAVQFAAGVHPHQAGHFEDCLDEVVPTFEAVIKRYSDVCAVGEIGLDYHYDLSQRTVQVEVFRRQIALARSCGLPIVIHTREADDDTIECISSEGGGDVTGVFHCFTGDIQFARRILDLGFHISFSGIVTFKRAEEIREAAAFVPLDRLLVETDSPYLAPTPHRGKRNEPAWVARVAEAVADVRGSRPSSLAERTSSSFLNLFGESQRLNSAKGCEN